MAIMLNSSYTTNMSTKTTKTKKPKPLNTSVSKSTSRSKTIKATIRHHKLLSFLILIIILIATNYGYIKYQDWDNAQLIKGLARDFPALVDQIERETGLNLSKRSDCSTTTEKFGDGVRTCELLVGDTGSSNEQTIKSAEVVMNTEGFKSTEYNPISKAHRVSFDSSNACTVAAEGTIYISCITAVREANIELAKDLFNDPRFADWND